MLKFLTGIVALAVVATAASAAQRQPCVTVSYDHQGVRDNNKPNTQQYIASQTGSGCPLRGSPGPNLRLAAVVREPC